MNGLKCKPRFYCKASCSLTEIYVFILNVIREVYSFTLEFLENISRGGHILHSHLNPGQCSMGLGSIPACPNCCLLGFFVGDYSREFSSNWRSHIHLKYTSFCIHRVLLLLYILFFLTL